MYTEKPDKPHQPYQPAQPMQPDRPGVNPQPILPSWWEPASVSVEQELADRLLAQRTILVGGRLDDALASHVTAQLLLLDAAGNDPVTLHLSSTESDLDAALSVAGAIDLIESPVHAVARGTVRGAAIAVLAAATEREAQRHTMFVLSTPRFTADGTADQLATLADQHDRQFARLLDLVATATGRPATEIAADLDPGRVLNATEAMEYGLITRVR
ncbi:ATP-dependent Clp protease proteolytic subunit [Kribbella solani]|uniref:ClpP family protease n=2 Tax=Kribbella solani TaxID=236067 RepID=UPI0029A021BC|nr:ATP-dependent Clp protease proteolytic subunit [Kribbella solani]MDX2969616.1 ATP-dependent Clp protease proteolytic subunit [Kribbella solani]MDX3006162.1 ATP-dependent Clp protease proteolytic subunit [Kribbella solani]